MYSHPVKVGIACSSLMEGQAPGHSSLSSAGVCKHDARLCACMNFFPLQGKPILKALWEKFQLRRCCQASIFLVCSLLGARLQ